MSQKLTESYIVTSRPGAYFQASVKSSPVGVASSGNIVIIGEADAGAAVSTIDSVNGDILKDNYFTPDQIDKVSKKYVSGQIVDAFRALSAPSSDSDISGSANNIFICKTNIGSKASAVLANAYGSLSHNNYGVNGNKYYYQVSQSVSETVPSITSDIISFSPVAEQGHISVKQSSMDDGDYFFIQAHDGIKFAVALDTTGLGSNIPTGAHYTGANFKISLDVSAISTDAALATAVIGAFNGLTGFTGKVTLVDHTSAVIGINQIVAGLMSVLPNAYDKTDAVSGASVGACAIAYVSSQTGDDADGSLFNGLVFAVRLNGGISASVTLSSTESNHDSVALLAAEIDALLPTGLNCAADSSQLVISMDVLADNAANALGYGRSFELIDSMPGDLAALELSAGLYSAAAQPEVQVNINRKDNNTNEEFTAEAEVALTVGYAGTTATMTITDTHLTTTVVGGAGANLNILLSNYTTLKDLANYIASQTDYSAAVIDASAQLSPGILDEIAGVGICSTAVAQMPGQAKRSVYNFSLVMSQSSSVDFVPTAIAGLPNKMSKVAYLSGGLRGATSAASVVNAMSALETINANFVIPLFSRNATSDIADGLTDSASTYTIDAINTLVKNHILKVSTPKIKRHRTAFCSYWGTYAEAKTRAQQLAHARVSLAMQRSSQTNSVGDIVSFMPWHTACIAAGMQAAGFYKAIVNKFANVISFVDPSGFDSGSPGDLEDALNAGLLILEQVTAGNKWVSDQTTYGVDTNFVYNSIQAMYAADMICLDLADSFQTAFVGKSVADVDAASALAFLDAKMGNYKRQKLIAASDDAALGYKNASVEINAPTMRVSVEIKLATAIYFISLNLEFSQVSSSATA